VQAAEAKLTALVNSYVGRKNHTAITVDSVRQRFFASILNAGQPHRTTLPAAFISYLLEWDYKSTLIGLSQEGSREPFFLHLFRGCLLFESLLKDNPHKPPTTWKLPAEKRTLAAILKNELSTELGIPSKMQTSSQVFDTIIPSPAGQAIQDAISCTVKVR